MEMFIGEHGQAIVYGIVGILMVLLICNICENKWREITPEYKSDKSKSNDNFIRENRDKYPTIEADEVIYADYKKTNFNCRDFIAAKDYQGNDISDRLRIYGTVNTSTRGVYRLRCVVVAENQLACTKIINVIVE